MRTSRWIVGSTLVLFLALPAVAQDGVVETIVGLYDPDGYPATDIALGRVYSAASDANGNVYFSAGDWGTRVFRMDTSGTASLLLENHAAIRLVVDTAGDLYLDEQRRIWKLDTSGNLTIVAGTGVPGYSGDGGPAVNAQINDSAGVALDSAGNLYIADTYNHRIRKVDTAGIITTVAGNGTAGFSGDGGPATSASMRLPKGVAVDTAGNLYIADTYNHRIRKVDTAGVITTVAGTGVGGHSGDGGPATSARIWITHGGLAVDSAGNIYINQTNRIRKVDTAGIITTVAGTGIHGFSGDGGPATSAQLNNAVDVSVDGNDRLLIADYYNFRIRRIDTAGIIDTIAGNGTVNYFGDGVPAIDALLDDAEAVTLAEDGSLYIVDEPNQRIRKVDTDGIITTVAGSGEFGCCGNGGPATSAKFRYPMDVAVDGDGTFYIADWYNKIVRKVDTDGIITRYAGTGWTGCTGDGGLAINARLFRPRSLALDADGNLYIADEGCHCVRKVDTSGVITTVAGTGVYGDSGDGGPAVDAAVGIPRGVETDDAGNLYIVTPYSHRVRKVDTAGIITTVAGTGIRGFSGDGGPATSARLSYPPKVDIDAAGNLYIADASNQRVRKVDTAGIITTVAGMGYALVDSGDGGPPLDAGFASLRDVAVDDAGNLYTATRSEGHGRIRRVVYNQSPVAVCLDASEAADHACVATASVDGGSYDPDDDAFTVTESPGGPFDLGVTEVTLTAEDEYGASDSCTDTVTVYDDTAPDVTCPPESGATADAQCQAPIPDLQADVTASDNCSTDLPLSQSPAAGDLVGWGFHSITSSATDEAGNVGECGTTFEVVDETAPTVTCPTLEVASADAQCLAPVPDLTAGLTTTDNCTAEPARSQSPAAGGLVGLGTHTLTGSATDEAANQADCTASFTVADTTPPDVIAPEPLVVTCVQVGADGVAQLPASDPQIAGWLASASASDNCDGPLPVSDNCPDMLGVNEATVDFSAVDAAGNQGQAASTVQVLYGWGGFKVPLHNDGSSIFAPNRTIPVKFTLSCNGTNVAGAEAMIAVFKVLDVATGTIDETDLTEDAGASNDNGSYFRYSAGGPHYIYNLSTKGWDAPATYRIIVTLDDGSTHSVDFSIRGR